MFKTYLKIAFRNFKTNKAFTLINILGLAAGLTACLLIMLYIFDERSYDQQHLKAGNIYRVASKNNKGETWAALAAPMAAAFKANLPEVEQAARLMTFTDISKMLVKYDAGNQRKQFFESNGYYVDSNFFNVLSYRFIYGDGATALNEPNSLVISKEMSQRYFGNTDPVNKVVVINTPFGEFNYTVKAIFESQQSHIPASYFLSMRNNDMWNWVKTQTAVVGNAVFFTYIKIKAGTNQAAFDSKLNKYFSNVAAADMKALGFIQTIFLQPVQDIYLHSALGNEIAANGNITYLYILGSIAAFILLIACINFMNLSTARSERRAKEVGVKKVIGADRSSLIWQFLTESFVMCVLALLIAAALVILLMPYFNSLVQKNIQLSLSISSFAWVAGLILLTGLFAGMYPAFYLSSFKPIAVLKGKIANHFSATAFRKGLVVFQFTVSVCLVIAALVVWQQLAYLKNQQLGFNKEQKIILPLQQGYLNNGKNYDEFKHELSKIPEVKSASSGSAYPGIVNLNDMLFFSEGKAKNDNVDVHLAAIENGYLETLGFKIINGRSFGETFTADSASIILNESAVKKLGYTVDNAVGKKVNYDVRDLQGALTIVGVVKDFNFESLHKGIEPYGFTKGIFANRYNYLVAGINTTNYFAVLHKVETAWAKLFPAVPFEYSFLDQDFQRNYQKEELTSSLISSFTIIAIIIACLGLFGLSAFAAERRTKEIGIRKVLGAGIGNLTLLLTKEFIVLVVIAIAIASPLAWFVMNKWLQNFVYHTNIGWSVFFLSGVIALFITLVTISFQSIKAALSNPIKSLRTE